MIKRSLYVDSSKFKIESKRQAVALVISSSDESLIMNCSLLNDEFVVSFIHDELYLGESSKHAAIRVLKNRGFNTSLIEYIGNVFVKNSVFDEVHVYYCKIKSYNVAANIIVMDHQDLSQLICNGIISDDLTKVVFYRYINYIGI